MSRFRRLPRNLWSKSPASSESRRGNTPERAPVRAHSDMDGVVLVPVLLALMCVVGELLIGETILANLLALAAALGFAGLAALLSIPNLIIKRDRKRVSLAVGERLCGCVRLVSFLLG